VRIFENLELEKVKYLVETCTNLKLHPTHTKKLGVPKVNKARPTKVQKAAKPSSQA
jgi:hypothetical protein